MELLELFAQGELEAFETLFRQFQGQVYGWVIRIVRDPGIAEDLTVETFWRIYRSRSRFDTARSFGAWARRIATNAAIDYLKTVRPEVLLTENQAQVVPPNPLYNGIFAIELSRPSLTYRQNSRLSRGWRSLKSNLMRRLQWRWESR